MSVVQVCHLQHIRLDSTRPGSVGGRVHSDSEVAVSSLISRDELKVKLDRGDQFTLVEAVPEEAYREAHLPGAINVPSDKVRELAPTRLPNKGADIVVYCAKFT